MGSDNKTPSAARVLHFCNNTEDTDAPAVRNERKKIKTSRRRESHPTAPESPSPTRALDFSSPLCL